MNKHYIDCAIAVTLGLAGVTAILASLSYGIMPTSSVLGAGTLPLITSILLVLAAISGAVVSLRKALSTSRLTRAALEEAPVKDSDLKALRTFGLTVLAVALVPFLGFLASMTVLIFVLLLLETRRIVVSAVVALCALGGINFLFVDYLGVPLP